jgi:hypothetical protein
MAGETQNYHETRNPMTQTADYASITGATTAKSIMSVTADIPGSSLVYPAGYWQIGKKWHVRMWIKMTTGAAVGNITWEIRMQTGTTASDAGGTIMATSAAVAGANSKTAANVFIDFTVESRGQLGTASPMFVKGYAMIDPTFAVWASTVNPIFIPSNASAATNFDTTLAGIVNVQAKNSGANASTYVVHDVQVNSIT